MKFKNIIESKEVIEVAINNSRLKFLRFVAESISLKKNNESADFLKRLGDLNNKNPRISAITKRRKSIITPKITNYWLYEMKISDLIKRFCENKNYEAIA
jgi:hypothetical protein